MQNALPGLLAASCNARTMRGMRTPPRFAWFDGSTSPPAVALAWCTIVVHAILMIALAWRWAFWYEPYTILGAGTLSALMLGFLGAAATVVKSLGRTAQPHTSRHEEQQDALLLFPAEDSEKNDLVLAPQLLATRRKALL